MSEFDSDGSGAVNESDQNFDLLRVWKDLNSDGVVQTGELYALKDAGVLSVNLNYVDSSFVDAVGNEHRQIGSYTSTSGEVHAVEDVWFAVNKAKTIDVSAIAISSHVSSLPEINGIGNVHSLQQTIMRDESGELEGLIVSFLEESDPAEREKLLLNIIYKWAGVEDVDPLSRAATKIYGNVIGDARKLAALETFLGEDYLGTWCWGEKDPNPHGPAAAILLQLFDNFSQVIYDKLMFQTHLLPYVSLIQYGVGADGGRWDVSALVARLEGEFLFDPDSTRSLIVELGRSFKSNELIGNDIISAFHASAPTVVEGMQSAVLGFGVSTISPTFGNDLLNGTAEGDYLFGLGGQDRIYGGGGDDLLNGGTGNDYLAGGDGADTYEFDRGDGRDTIFNADQNGSDTKLDKLFFGAGITEADIVARRNYYDLILEIKGTSDSVTIQSYFDEDTVANHGYAVDQIVFTDGSFWSIDKVKEIVQRTTDGDDAIWGDAGVNTLNGGAGNDSLHGMAGDDILAGGEGDDALYGETGDDLLEGGAGTDYLSGGSGSDTYLFKLGDGQDVIDDVGLSSDINVLRFGVGILASDIKVGMYQFDLVISHNNLGDPFTPSEFRILLA
ncbi:calcium-binding protein [Pseudomonas sp. F01002]|nr:calcium-binding protein [Pseudomonas sp. F01002]